jgi:hypothetical protein
MPSSRSNDKPAYTYSASDLASLEAAAKEARERISTWQQHTAPTPAA